jgi:2-keto-4-pentenoate hydratase/2-oxohepta-3-ene-1,7-dioic acid hydratase in catechol pathway
VEYGKILCIGLNYGAHAAEGGREPPTEPVIFAKFKNTLIGDGDTIVLPPESTHTDSEAELAVVIGKTGHRISEDDALDFVAGYLCANDVSARNVQSSQSQWVRGKGFDTFCPVGPGDPVPVKELGDGSGLRIQQRLNGDVLQDSNTDDLIFNVRFLVSYLSNTWTLEPGDLILTGTPEGVGLYRDPPIAMADGDVVEIEIDGIGVLRNPVAAEKR